MWSRTVPEHAAKRRYPGCRARASSPSRAGPSRRPPALTKSRPFRPPKAPARFTAAEAQRGVALRDGHHTILRPCPVDLDLHAPAPVSTSSSRGCRPRDTQAAHRSFRTAPRLELLRCAATFRAGALPRVEQAPHLVLAQDAAVAGTVGSAQPPGLDTTRLRRTSPETPERGQLATMVTASFRP